MYSYTYKLNDESLKKYTPHPLSYLGTSKEGAYLERKK